MPARRFGALTHPARLIVVPAMTAPLYIITGADMSVDGVVERILKAW